MPVTLLLVPPIQNAIYTLFHPIQTKGADYAHHNTTSPPPQWGESRFIAKLLQILSIESHDLTSF